MQPFPVLQVAKVLGIHRHGHTVDVILLNGGTILEDVPILGWGGSTFGLAGLMAPTSDRHTLGRKTYPPENRASFLYPRGNTETTRDIYVVVAQIEGSQRGRTGMVALGMLFPTISEMTFPGDLYPDFFLFRHPSDVQGTIDQHGSISLQHPTGARITLENARPAESPLGLPDGPPSLPENPGLPGGLAGLLGLPGLGDLPGLPGQEAEAESTPPALVDLQARDFHTLYKLRANIPAAFAATGRVPALFVRIPKLLLDEAQDVGGGEVTEGLGAEASIPPFVRSPAAFPTNTTVEIPDDPLIALVMSIQGEKTRVVRAAPLPNGETALVVSPPLLSAPAVGTSFTLQRIPVVEAGEVYVWFDKAGDLRSLALWTDLEGGIQGQMFDRTGTLHDTLVEAGDKIETAHAGEESGGNVRNRADVDHQTSAGEANRMENDAGCVVLLGKDGSINISAPGNIDIVAGGVMNLVGHPINENIGGEDAGDEGSSEQDGFKLPGSGSGGDGFKIPGVEGFKVPTMPGGGGGSMPGGGGSGGMPGGGGGGGGGGGIKMPKPGGFKMPKIPGLGF